MLSRSTLFKNPDTGPARFPGLNCVSTEKLVWEERGTEDLALKLITGKCEYLVETGRGEKFGSSVHSVEFLSTIRRFNSSTRSSCPLYNGCDVDTTGYSGYCAKDIPQIYINPPYFTMSDWMHVQTILPIRRDWHPPINRLVHK